MKSRQKTKIIKIERVYDGYRISYRLPDSKVAAYTIHYGLLNFTEKELANINRKDGYSAIYIENAIINSQHLSLSEKLTYIMIKSFCNKNRVAYPSIELLADASGHSHTTIIEAIDGLIKKGVIMALRKRKREDDRRYLNNIYMFRESKDSEHHTYVPFNLIFSKGLNINAKMIYIFLLSMAKNGYIATVTKRELLEFSGLREWDTIRRHIETLHKLGWIFTYCSTTKGSNKEKAICFLIRRVCPQGLVITEEDLDKVEAMI